MKLPSYFHARPVRVLLAGCGGTGSHALSGLARLHTCLRAVDHPGLEVTAADPDRVSEANVGRQLFAASDLGHPKADVLVHRLNLWYDLAWQARPEPVTADFAPDRGADLLIGCVDSAAARHALDACARAARIPFWLDCGNDDRWGQVVLGQPVGTDRLPTVLEIFPDMRDAGDTGPSCSLAESLGRQGAFINQAIATLALDALWTMFRSGRIDRFAWFLNLADGRMTSLDSDPATRARLTRSAGQDPAA